MDLSKIKLKTVKAEPRISKKQYNDLNINYSIRGGLSPVIGDLSAEEGVCTIFAAAAE